MTTTPLRNLTIIGSDDGLSPGRHQAIIRTNAGLLLIEPLGTNFNEVLIEIHTFSFRKMHLKLSSGKCRPFCLDPNVLIHIHILPHRIALPSPLCLMCFKRWHMQAGSTLCMLSDITMYNVILYIGVYIIFQQIYFVLLNVMLHTIIHIRKNW